MEINKFVFRAYDIRGEFPKDINENFAYILGRSFGTYIQNLDKKKVVIGRDIRKSSPLLRDNLVRGLLSTGVDVIDLGIVTTPMYYYGCILLDISSGIMITASHNPKDDNGFKFAFDERGNARGEMISEFLDFTLKKEFINGNGKLSFYDIKEEYIKELISSINLGPRKVRVLLDNGNATPSVIVRDVFERLDIDFDIIYEEIDNDFPNHHPDPAVESNLEVLKQKVISGNYDLGIGFDGDGDRIGIVDNDGTFIPGDLMMIIAIRSIILKVSNKTFSYDVKCTKSLEDEIIKLGGTPVCYRTGNSYGKSYVIDNNLPFGGELSGHLFFNDKFKGFDSAVYAALRYIEILSWTDKPFSTLLDGINRYISTPEIKIEVGDDKKDKIVEYVHAKVIDKNYHINDIDGIRVSFNDGWALVRKSNTGPHLTLRFEGINDASLDRIKQEFTQIVEEAIKVIA